MRDRLHVQPDNEVTRDVARYFATLPRASLLRVTINSMRASARHAYWAGMARGVLLGVALAIVVDAFMRS